MERNIFKGTLEMFSEEMGVFTISSNDNTFKFCPYSYDDWSKGVFKVGDTVMAIQDEMNPDFYFIRPLNEDQTFDSLSDEKIEEAMNKAYKKAGPNAYFGNGFHAGVEYALKELVPSKGILIQPDYKAAKEFFDALQYTPYALHFEYYAKNPPHKWGATSFTAFIMSQLNEKDCLPEGGREKELLSKAVGIPHWLNIIAYFEDCPSGLNNDENWNSYDRVSGALSDIWEDIKEKIYPND
jgi:hypothetical protein